MNFEIILATNNKHKLQEVREILSPHKIVVYGLADLNLKVEEVEENGSTYFENALLKAKAVQKLTTMPIIADDSGLEIEALDNQPGLFSARFAESLGGHNKAIEEILNQLRRKNNRNASFICDLCVLNMEKQPLRFEGVCKGTISSSPKGETGFGYDPIFIPENLNKTYAEIQQKEKNLISHRGKALKKFITYLKINQSI